MPRFYFFSFLHETDNLFYMKPIIFLITGVPDVAVLDIVEEFPGANI